MEYRYLGSSGLRVSSICLGTHSFGKRPDGPPHCLTEEQSHGILDEFLLAGGNFIDTSGSYGLPEEYVGNWLCKQERGDIIMATKVRYATKAKTGTKPNIEGLSRSAIIRDVEDSLQRLRTDYIDLLQMHCWDVGTPIEETLSTFNDLVRQGRVRYLGASNLTGWQLQKIAEVSRKRGWEPFVSVQQQWNLLSRGAQLECVDVCRNEGIGILPWSPLMGGWLSGKYKRGMTAADLSENTRVGWVNQNPGSRSTFSHVPYDKMASDDHTWCVVDALNDVAEETGRSCSQVALRWLLQKDVVPAVVTGVTSSKQLHDNIGAVGWHLTEQQISTLDDASATRLPYPYNLNRVGNIARMRNSRLK